MDAIAFLLALIKQNIISYFPNPKDSFSYHMHLASLKLYGLRHALTWQGGLTRYGDKKLSHTSRKPETLWLKASNHLARCIAKIEMQGNTMDTKFLSRPLHP